MGRISREQMFMEMARSASRRSTCFRLNVGAIVVQGHNPISIGYNGQEPGAPHCLGNDCPGVVPGKCGTLHAEVNALTKAGTLLSSSYKSSRMTTMGLDSLHFEADLYCTDSPCGFCTEFMLEDSLVKVQRIFYETPYRDMSHLGRFHGRTEVYQVTPAGYIVDHFTRKVVELP